MAALIGGKGDDVLTGGDGPDLIEGRGGDDTLSGGGGRDDIAGGAGNDTIAGGAGDDELAGGAGNDAIDGGNGADTLRGGTGDDSLAGGAGNDDLGGGAGNDTLAGGAGNDEIRGGDGDDTVLWHAGDGDDVVRGGDGTDTFIVTTSDTVQQTVRVTAGSNGRVVVTVEGEGGGVVVLDSIEDLKFIVGSGGARIVVDDGVLLPPLDIAGTDDANVIDQSGTAQSASIDAGAGNDVALGGDAADTIDGGAGNDRIDGGGGADVIDAGTGDDEIVWTVGGGNDVVQGGDGVDELEVSLSPAAGSMLSIAADAGGNVILTSSSGEQVTADGVEDIVVNAAAGGSTVTVGNLTGTDVAQSSVHFVGDAGADVVDASATDRRIEAQGNGGNDTLQGGSAGDLLAGGAEDDALRGNGGDDVLDGGEGNDEIAGGAGDDLLMGGAGADRYFVVDPGQTVVDIGNDTITDFEANDIVDLTPVATITSLEQLLAASRQEGADTVIDLGEGNSIRLAGVALSSLTAANFVFATPPIVGTENVDVLQGTPGDDRIFGLGGDDLLGGRAGSDLLDGGDGTDAAVYISDPGPIVANLSAESITVDGVTVAPNTVREADGNIDTLVSVEAILGTNQADTLIGSDEANNLSGLNGADTIDGGAGDDIIGGGAGVDSLDGGAGFDVLALGGQTALGGPGVQGTVNSDGSVTSVDTLTGDTETAVNFELVVGTSGNDTIMGSDGNDFLGGGFGSDFLGGGGGIDTAVYTFSLGTVLTIDLASGTSAERFTPSVPPGVPPPPTFTAADTLIGIENAIGSAAGETIIGNDGDNVLEGGAGNDLLRGGAGNDTLNGGQSILLPNVVISIELDGTDTADYSVGAANGVDVNLVTGIASDGAGGTDTLLSIENVNGSLFADTIVGDDGANVLSGLESGDVLRGNGGADTIDGGGGNDFITGGAGDDTLTGSAGADRYLLVDSGETVVDIGHDTITDFAPGDVIDLTPIASLTSLAQVLALSRQEGADTVIDLGNGNTIRLAGVALGSLTAGSFVFAGGPQFPPGAIVGTEGNNTLNGTPLADSIFGLGGNDTLIAQAGADLLDGGDGSDVALYLSEPGPIIANLSAASITVGGITVEPGTVRDGAGSIDVLVSVESIALLGPASNFADTLIGSDGANQLSGGGGADTILGGDGHDTISGGAGIDIMDGGAGFDIVVFGDPVPTNGPGLDITVNADGTITAVGAAGTEANLPNFEMLSGTLGNDTITGNADDNMLGGGFGSDIIDGGAGIDTINYQFNPPSPGSVLTVDLAAGTSLETFTTPLTPIPGIPTQTFTASDTLINIENVSGTTGVDHLFGDAGDNVLQGFLGDDRLRGGAGNDTLDGNVFTLFTHLENTGPSPLDGSDTADYATDPNGVDVNLAAGVATDGFGDTDTLVSIENVTGSAFADTIVGDGGANVLEGLAGADTLQGGDGDDRLIGGAGVDALDGGAGLDVVDYSSDAIEDSAPGLMITIAGTTVTAFNATLGESEVATNVEVVVGSAGDDVVIGGSGDDTYVAGSGDDLFDGGAGSDTIRLGTAVAVDLAAGTVSGLSGTLALANVENVTAAAGIDTLRGNAAANVLIGGLGDDVLAGRGGADTLIGGALGVASTDVDTVDYSEDSGSVTVDLAAGTAIDGSGAADALLGIENAIGSAFDDVLTGDSGSNVLTGLDGDDVLTGGGGADTFVATVDAGDAAAFGNDVITDFDVVLDAVSLRAFPDIASFADVQARLTQDGADAVLALAPGHSVRLLNVDATTLTASNFVLLSLNIVGTEASETLTGDIGNDTILGLGGNDTLNGLAGDDTLDGGAGSDTLNGGPGDDTLLDSDGNARMNGGPGDDTINGSPYYGADPAGIVANLSNASLDVNGDGSFVLAPRTVRDGYGDIDTIAGTALAVNASYFDDHVVGSAEFEQFFLFAGNDRAFGMDGNDTFFGGSGDDYIDGGAGMFDALFYSTVAEDGGTALPNQGVRLNLSATAVDIGNGVVLAANSGTDQYGDLDSVFNVEIVNGTQFGDIIVGSNTTLQLSSLDGDDTLLGGRANETLDGGRGNDVIDGGDGFDTALYFAGAGVVVDLGTQTAFDGQGGIDVIRNVESIAGSQFGDDLSGDEANNNLSGNGGDDVLRGAGGDDALDGGDGADVVEGGAGNDQLTGGANDDVLTGGEGFDFFSFVRNTQIPSPTNFGADVVTDFSVADDLLNVSQVPELTSLAAVLARASVNPQGVLISIDPLNSIQLNGLTLADLEQVSFVFAPLAGTPGDDVLDGTDAAETLNGFGGNDIINGNGGGDFIAGGDGNDTLNGGDDGDVLVGDAGNDVLNGEAGNDFLDGGSGDDTLTGGAGTDAFRSAMTGAGGFGRDVVTDFAHLEDRLDLSGIPGMTSLDALNAAAVEVGADVVITIDGSNSITLRNVSVSELRLANVTWAPFIGTPGDDVLNGSSGNDTISGLGGNDTIAGNGGNDSLFGGDGNDDISGGDGSDNLSGELGDDVLDGGAGQDVLHGGAGNDTLTGGGESDYFNMRDGGQDVVTDFAPGDTLDLSSFPSLTSRAALEDAAEKVGSEVVITIDATNSITLRNFSIDQLALANVILAPLTGTEGNDVLNGTDAGELIDGLGGDDVINGFGGGDSLFGGAGNDTLDGGVDGDFLVGGSGNDTLVGGDGFDTLEGGFGDDSLTGGADVDFFRMQSGRDTITDYSPTDVLDLSLIPTMTGRAALTAAALKVGDNVEITTGAGDVITLADFSLEELAQSDVRFAPFVGTEGDDVLNGTEGNDIIQGRGGDDLLNGADGDDQLFGEDGNDTLNGGTGSDLLTPGRGNDTVDGGESPNDYVDFGFNVATGAVVDLEGGTANDGNGGVDVIGNVENVYGTPLNDTVAGDAGSNSLHGFAGDDELLGRGGNDNLNGYDGNDTLAGGAGDDFLWGGDGDDLFVFAAGDGNDAISSFEAGAGSADVIDLRNFGFADFAAVQAVTADDVSSSAVIDLGGGDRITLLGVSSASLDADDFLL